MQSIKPAFLPVNICLACNDNYAGPLSVCLYSLLCNADKSRLYDVVILHSGISDEKVEIFKKIEGHFACSSIRLVDMTDFRERVKNAVYSYITAETNFRLAILGELFSQYDRMIYLDCDTIVVGDISELFDMDLKGKALGAVPGSDITGLRYTKKGKFVDDVPYNIENYMTKFLGISDYDSYFNAGVLVFDLKQTREFTSELEAVELLNRRKWLYNDQDTLNMIFKDRVHLLDSKWNYTTNTEYCMQMKDAALVRLMKKHYRTEYGIIHYTSGNKPWTSNVPLDEHYHKYEKELEKVISTGSNEDNRCPDKSKVKGGKR